MALFTFDSLNDVLGFSVHFSIYFALLRTYFIGLHVFRETLHRLGTGSLSLLHYTYVR